MALLASGCTCESEPRAASPAPVPTRSAPAPAAPAARPPPLDAAAALASVDVEFIATPPEVVARMLTLAEVGKDDLVVDLGCGDGRIVVMAAQRFGARARGIEIDPSQVVRAREAVRRAGVGDRVQIVHGDIFDADISDATVVTLFLSETVNTKLLPKLRTLKSGARVVSHDFGIIGVPPRKTELVTPARQPEPVRGGREVTHAPSRVLLWKAPL